jgi:ABC-type Fe3+-hydroxamate transport system substrate-binding protein
MNINKLNKKINKIEEKIKSNNGNKLKTLNLSSRSNKDFIYSNKGWNKNMIEGADES